MKKLTKTICFALSFLLTLSFTACDLSTFLIQESSTQDSFTSESVANSASATSASTPSPSEDVVEGVHELLNGTYRVMTQAEFDQFYNKEMTPHPDWAIGQQFISTSEFTKTVTYTTTNRFGNVTTSTISITSGWLDTDIDTYEPLLSKYESKEWSKLRGKNYNYDYSSYDDGSYEYIYENGTSPSWYFYENHIEVDTEPVNRKTKRESLVIDADGTDVSQTVTVKMLLEAYLSSEEVNENATVKNLQYKIDASGETIKIKVDFDGTATHTSEYGNHTTYYDMSYSCLYTMNKNYQLLAFGQFTEGDQVISGQYDESTTREDKTIGTIKEYTIPYTGRITPPDDLDTYIEEE